MPATRSVVFESYIANAFGAYEQSSAKISEFRFNYSRYLPKDAKARILDIGVGRGEMLTLLRMQGYVNHEGIDISPDAVGFCRSLGLNCRVTKRPIAFLKQKREEYHCITMLDVLEHVERDIVFEYVAAVRSALKPNGMLIVQVPNMQSPDPALHRYNDITHECGFVEHSLFQLLSTAKFSSIEFFPFENPGRGVRFRSRILLRSVLYAMVRFRRRVNSDLNPEILTPVFFAIAKKK